MDFKQNVTDAELNQVLAELNISKDDAKTINCTPTAAIAEGDVFTLTGVSKVRETIENGFLPLVFTTSNGKLIGTKHFGSVEFPKDADGVESIGRTVEDAVKYLIWTKKNAFEFEVDRVKKLEARKIKNVDGTETEYVPKRIELSVKTKKSK